MTTQAIRESGRAFCEDYLRQTLYRADDLFALGQGAEGGTGEPLKWKLYRGVERIALTGGGAGAPVISLAGALSGERTARSSALAEGDLSAMLQLSYGFVRWEPGPGPGWALHRTVPSARCFFPTELYVAVPRDLPGVEAGVYHYDAAHHMLARLRGGEAGRLSEIAGADLTGASWVLLVSSMFWKTAFKYRNYAYRLCTQEAGMVVGNVLAVAAALGLDAHVHYQFIDRAANRLLGLEAGQESVLAVVPVYPPGARPDGLRRLARPVGEDRLCAAIPEICPAHLDAGRLDEDLCGMVSRIDASSYIHHTEDIALQHLAPAGCGDGPWALLPVPPGGPTAADFVTAVRARNSGRVTFTPARQPVSARALFDLARHSSRPTIDDLRPAGQPAPLSVHLAVNHVDRCHAGVYRWCPDHDGLHLVTAGDVTEPLRSVLKVPNADLSAANLVAFVAGDHVAAIRAFGGRSYRILNMETGVVTQRICLLSAAYGLSARVHNGYDATAAKDLLRLPGPDWTPFFQIIVGRDSPGVRYGFPIPF